MIDIRRLHVLRAVAYHGTVTEAARSLHLTPSAASQQIRQLGRDLGVRLLEPHGRNVRLTAGARALLAAADEIAERWERAEAELAPIEPAGELRLCGLPTAIPALLAPTVARLNRRWPGVLARIREAEAPDCYDLLFADEVDLGVTMASPGSPPPTDARFEQVPLLDDPFDLLTAVDHPLAGRTGLALTDLADQPWIVSMLGTSYRQMVFAFCNSAGFTPIIAHEALEWTAVANLVGYGLGISLVPRLAQLPVQPKVTRTPLAGAATPYRRFITVTRAGGRHAPAMAAALELLTEIAAEHRTRIDNSTCPVIVDID